MPWWSRPLVWLLLWLAGVRWRGIFALPQGSTVATRSLALNTSAMFLVQCPVAEATGKDTTLDAINMFYNHDVEVITKVTFHGERKCDVLALYTRGVSSTLIALLDHYDPLNNLTCEYVYKYHPDRRSASVTMVNVTSFNVCRSSRCGGPGRPFSCGPGQVGMECPKDQGWVVQRRVNGNWTNLGKATNTCDISWPVQDAVLVEGEDQDLLAGKIVDVTHYVSEKRFAYVHPNGTCQICVVDAALADHSSFLGLPENSNVVVVLSVTVGVLLVIVVVLLLIILCLYLRRGNPSPASWRCLLQRRRAARDNVETFIDAAPSENRRTDSREPADRDETESQDLLGPHSDSSVSVNKTTNDFNKSDG